MQRKHARRPRRQPRCTMCTKYNWLGNSKERRPHRDHKRLLD